MKFTSKKHFFILFSIISLLGSSIATYILKINNLPVEISIERKYLNREANISDIFVDLNNDGISEYIRFISNNEIIKDYILLLNFADDTINEQFNLFSKSNIGSIFFEDLNKDGYKEIFAFSQNNDSLFLSIINIKSQSFLEKKQFLLSKPDSAVGDFWDIYPKLIELADVNHDGFNEIVFYINAGHSIYPRGVYQYDFKNKTILNKFESGAAILGFSLLDIDYDGINEVVLNTASSGNSNVLKGIHDNTSWLIALDKNLKPLFNPKSFGAIYEGITTFAYFNNDQPSILVNHQKRKIDNSFEYITQIFNYSGEIVDSLKDLQNDLASLSMFIENGDKYFYAIRNRSQLVKFNSNLELINTSKYLKNGYQSIYPKFTFPFQNKECIIIGNYNRILLFDNELNILGKYDPEEIINFNPEYFSIKLNGNDPPQLVAIGTKHNFIFNIEKNQIYTFLPLLFLLFFISLIILQIGLHQIITFFSTYYKYFGFSLNKTSTGVAIFTHSKKVFYANSNFREYLKIVNPIKVGNYYKIVLLNRHDILDFFENSFIKNSKQQSEIHISSSEYQFEGNISITPFTSFLGFTYAYLVEISDYTKPLLTDRGKVWSATLQRIAHEIKTPLSTIILSLDNVRYKIGTKDNEINEEIHRMQNELERIKQLTKNFMLFSNIAEQKFTAVSLNKILNTVYENFRSYFEKDVNLKLYNIDFEVLGDFNQLVQLFSLSVENAIDAINGEGEIQISAEKTDTNFIKISVFDNGIGMTDETMIKVFEPYYTTKQDGTGMGLTIMKKIAKDHNGKIEIQSELNKGTNIIITLQTK